MNNNSQEGLAHTLESPVFDQYALSRHKRPSENFKSMLMELEGFQDSDKRPILNSFYGKFRNIKDDLRENRFAASDLLSILLALSLMLYILYQAPVKEEAPVLLETVEPTVFSDELLDLTGIVPPKSVISFSELQTLVQGQNFGSHVQVLESDQGLSLQLNSRVLFNDGVFELARSGEPLLGGLMPSLLEKSQHITVHVHTNGFEPLYGEISSEMALSERRAEALQTYFISNGFNKSDVSVKAYGNRQPISTGSRSEDRARNSRVLLTIE